MNPDRQAHQHLQGHVVAQAQLFFVYFLLGRGAAIFKI